MFNSFNIYSKILATVGILLFVLSFFLTGMSVDIIALFLILSGILLARNNFVDYSPGFGLWLYYGLLIIVLGTSYFMWFL